LRVLANPRLFDIEGSGLSLGLRTLSLEEVSANIGIEKEVYADAHRTFGSRHGGEDGIVARNVADISLVSEKLKVFVEEERKRLCDLRDILTGAAAAEERLGVLVDECDYLWGHFPDCAGGRRPDLADGSQETLSFLKRVRIEIDSMLALLERPEN
jgi:hypothetical protein